MWRRLGRRGGRNIGTKTLCKPAAAVAADNTGRDAAQAKFLKHFEELARGREPGQHVRVRHGPNLNRFIILRQVMQVMRSKQNGRTGAICNGYGMPRDQGLHARPVQNDQERLPER